MMREAIHTNLSFKKKNQKGANSMYSSNKTIYYGIGLSGKFMPIFDRWRKDRSEYIRTIENK